MRLLSQAIKAQNKSKSSIFISAALSVVGRLVSWESMAPWGIRAGPLKVFIVIIVPTQNYSWTHNDSLILDKLYRARQGRKFPPDEAENKDVS